MKLLIRIAGINLFAAAIAAVIAKLFHPDDPKMLAMVTILLATAVACFLVYCLIKSPVWNVVVSLAVGWGTLMSLVGTPIGENWGQKLGPPLATFIHHFFVVGWGTALVAYLAIRYLPPAKTLSNLLVPAIAWVCSTITQLFCSKQTTVRTLAFAVMFATVIVLSTK